MKDRNTLIIAGSIIIASIIIVVGIKINKSPQEICFDKMYKNYKQRYSDGNSILYATQDCYNK